MEKNSKNLNYFFDKEADVLYVSLGTPLSREISDEAGDGIIVRRDPESGAITGFTVLNFLARQKAGRVISLPISVRLEPA